MMNRKGQYCPFLIVLDPKLRPVGSKGFSAESAIRPERREAAS
jgi:hypothetical protein